MANNEKEPPGIIEADAQKADEYKLKAGAMAGITALAGANLVAYEVINNWQLNEVVVLDAGLFTVSSIGTAYYFTKYRQMRVTRRSTHDD